MDDSPPECAEGVTAGQIMRSLFERATSFMLITWPSCAIAEGAAQPGQVRHL